MSAQPQHLPFEKARRLSIQESFEAFHRANPDVYRLLCKFARDAKARGVRRWGIKAIFEVIRWHIKVDLQRTDEFKLNNIYTSRYARLIEEHEPDLKGFFETRKLKSE